MSQSEHYNTMIDEVVERLKLIESAGVDYIELGPKPALKILFEKISKCTLCPEHKNKISTAKINLGGEGLRAELAFVLDAELTKDSEELKLLIKMIKAMGLEPEDVYITSTVKCVSKEPSPISPEALSACKGFLIRELEYVSPSIVVALGEEAARAFIETPLPFDSIRGRFQNPASANIKKSTAGFQVMPTHPLDQLIGDKEKKRDSWGDLKKIMAKLNLKSPE